jgi:hypothetical protein
MRKKNFLRKDASKQANFEEPAYDEKTTIYTKTAFDKQEFKSLVPILFLGDGLNANLLIETSSPQRLK